MLIERKSSHCATISLEIVTSLVTVPEWNNARMEQLQVFVRKNPEYEDPKDNKDAKNEKKDERCGIQQCFSPFILDK